MLPVSSEKSNSIGLSVEEIKEMKEPEKPVALPSFRRVKKGKPGSRAIKRQTESAPPSESH
ncbi:hypothetical protein ONS95_006947 [Cadophora gregata]|uniref:uncharacterized protein n=1 Tax=Cadophora gregata TaxID=51156 RepID=UPI0026DD0DDE|nr:uncharacterized protein ONS95_006947 [Cadophora gregata]KAK0101797.1 hypothetical protein ONS95_006947 [Cadophora gregata]